MFFIEPNAKHAKLQSEMDVFEKVGFLLKYIL